MSIFTSTEKKVNPLKAAVNLLLLTIGIVLIFWFSLSRIGVTFHFSLLFDLRERLLQGFIMTIYLSLASLFVSMFLGVLSALMQSSKILFFRYLAKLYVTFIRGTPLIMQIYLFYYIIAMGMGLEDKFVAGVIVLSLFEGAYIAEIIRGSLLSIEGSQLEAAKAVGFTNRQTVCHVILPQLFARTLPALTGQFASIIKDSSLLSVIAIIEMTQTIREITAINLKMFEGYIFLGAAYLLLTLPISFASRSLERRFDYEN